MPEFDIVCLANSKKHGGRCVAGLRADGQGWIRPVGWSPEGTLSPCHYRLPDGTDACPLDLLRIRFIQPRPEPHHPENWLLAQASWRLLSRPAPQSILPMLRSHLVAGPDLLGDRSDRRPFSLYQQSPTPNSLALIAPKDVQWIVQVKPNGERRLRVAFTLRGASYNLPLTDPVWEQRLSAYRPGTYSASRVGLNRDDLFLLIISLSEPFQKDSASEKCCHKLAAAVMGAPPSWRAALTGDGASSQVSKEDEGYDWSWLADSARPQAVVASHVPEQSFAVPNLSCGTSAPGCRSPGGMSEKAVPQEPETASAMETARAEHPRAYEEWTEAEDKWLAQLVRAGQKPGQIARVLQRQTNAIHSRMKKLGL